MSQIDEVTLTIEMGNLEKMNQTMDSLEKIKDKYKMTLPEEQTMIDMIGILEGIKKAPWRFNRIAH